MPIQTRCQATDQVTALVFDGALNNLEALVVVVGSLRKVRDIMSLSGPRLPTLAVSFGGQDSLSSQSF